MRVVHIDTHVAIWLLERRRSKLSRAAEQRMRRSRLLVSPFVLLELHHLSEGGRIDYEPEAVLTQLATRLGAETSKASLAAIIERAVGFAWTRDPFDRLIVANAMADGCELVTADERVRTHFAGAIW